MSEAVCGKCNTTFAYDEEAGLNVKMFEPWSDSRRFFMGGVFPACPNCGEMYRPPVVDNEIRVKKVWLPVRPDALTQGAGESEAADAEGRTDLKRLPPAR